MSDLIGIFGGTGAVLLAIGGCFWKCFQSYDVDYEWEPSNSNKPIETLNNTWEHRGHSAVSENDFGPSFRRMVYAKSTTDKKWEIKLKKGEGGVYIYKDLYNRPSLNNGHRFLRIRLKNVPEIANICFVHKYWSGTASEWILSEFHPQNEQQIPSIDGIHTYYEQSLIGTDDVTKEQMGINFDATNTEYDCILEEAYDKKKYSICNVICCKKHLLTFFYIKKANDKG